MDYENKYKESIERAKSLTDFCSDSELKTLEYVFPELKESESEDERIKQELIDYFSQYEVFNDRPVCEYIAWLEKQGQKPQGKSALEAAKEEKIDNSNSVNGVPFDYENATIAQKDFASKQDEKPANDTDEEIVEAVKNASVLDMVEPKFKIGDWILYSGDYYEGVRHITKIDENGYYIERNGLPHGIIPFNHEICMKLWTIEDAKDGDVLVNGSNIFIFHFINDTRLMGYCHVNIDDGRFYDDKGKNECFCLIDAVVYPSTKEQRDLLFQKMKEAGYEWDADKLKLKKSQRRISTEAKEALYSKPSEWTGEDEYYFQDLVFYFNEHTELQNKRTDITNWLKSLKERMKG